MEDPVREIPKVIRTLTTAAPAAQQQTIEKYFAPNASFVHPFCRTGSFDGSRAFIQYIYRWYKMMSPRIDLDVKSVAFDEANLLLYVSLHQTFCIQFLPFHRSEVDLTTVLTLTTTPNEIGSAANAASSSSSDTATTPPATSPTVAERPAPLTKDTQQISTTKKFYILQQNDLYQTNEFVKFVLPWFTIGSSSVIFWQYFATVACMFLAILFWPVTWVEQNVWGANRKGSLLEIVGYNRQEDVRRR